MKISDLKQWLRAYDYNKSWWKKTSSEVKQLKQFLFSVEKKIQAGEYNAVVRWTSYFNYDDKIELIKLILGFKAPIDTPEGILFDQMRRSLGQLYIDFERLYKEKILTAQNIKILRLLSLHEENCDEVVNILIKIKNVSWIHEADNFNKYVMLTRGGKYIPHLHIPNIPKPENIINNLLIIEALFDERILTNDILKEIHRYETSYPHSIANAYAVLNKAGILESKNKKLLKGHKYPHNIAGVLASLHQSSILNKENIEKINLFYEQADDYSCLFRNLDKILAIECINLLNQAKMLSQENFDLMISYPDTIEKQKMISIIKELKKPPLLDENNYNLIKNRPHACRIYFISILQSLNALGLLTAENRIIADRLSDGNIQQLWVFLNQLFARDLNTRDNISQVMLYADIFSNHQIFGMLSRIPPHMPLSQDNFNDFIRVCCNNELGQEEKINQIVLYITNLVNNLQPNLQRNRDPEQLELDPNLNADTQGTHLTSVHTSVSASALKLLKRYPNIENAEELKKIKNYLEKLPQTDKKNKAAMQCFNRLKKISEEIIDFKDSRSNITTMQLLALSWHAIHDNSSRIGSTENAEKQFIEGLYEIQRGYNLDENNNDDNQEDLPICAAGAFNKMVEKLASTHPDVEIVIINKTLESLKFPQVVLDEALTYLIKFKNMHNSKELSNLINNITENGIEAIWTEINSNISNRMFEEFGSLYNNENDDNFKALIDTAIYLPTENLLQKFDEMIASINEQKFKDITKEISDKYDSYYNPCGTFSFFKSLFRTFEEKEVNDMKDELRNEIKQGNFGKAIIIVQNQLNYIANDNKNFNQNGSLYKRLNLIKEHLVEKAPFQNYVHSLFIEHMPEEAATRNFYKKSNVIGKIECALMDALDSHKDDAENDIAQAIITLINNIQSKNNFAEFNSIRKVFDALKNNMTPLLEKNTISQVI